MLAMTRRPSATTPGITENSLSSSTIWATARVAGAPLPMATPMSASFRAKASLTPSPVMATTWSRAWRAPTMARFCWGVTRPNTECSAIASASPSASSGSSRASMVCSAPGRPTRLAHGADGEGVVPGDDLQVDALVGEVAQGVGGVGADLLLEAQQGDGAQARPAGCRRPGLRTSTATSRVRLPVRRRLFGLDPHRFAGAGVGQHHLGGPEHPGSVALEGGRAPLAGRGERHRRAALPALGPRMGIGEGQEGGVGVGLVTERAEGRVEILTTAVEGLGPGEDDLALGQRAGLVQAEHVDPGQPLDRGQLLDEDPPAGERHRGGEERDAGEQDQPFGDHADEAGHRSLHRLPARSTSSGSGSRTGSAR